MKVGLEKTFILLAIITTLNCKAQIAPLYFADPDLPAGTYYKDLDNDLNKFEGTWIWQNGNNSFQITLEKKEHIPIDNNTKFSDEIIGEYRYTENGVEIINSLSRLNDSNISGYDHYISGTIIMNKYSPPLKCFDCTDDNKRIKICFHDPGTPHIPMDMILRHNIENAVEKLQVMIVGGGSYVDSTTYPNTPRIPFGEYLIFIKQ